MGGVQQYKWRCAAAFPFPQSLEARKAQRYKYGGGGRIAEQIGGVLQDFLDNLYGGG